ncbi:Protein kinase domain-containing protein [Sergentomyia squamirostris]
MSNIGWNFPGGAGGADQRPIQPIPPPQLPPHETIAASTISYAANAPPPSYQSVYPTIPNSTSMPPPPPQSVSPQHYVHMAVPTATTTHTSSSNSFLSNLPQISTILPQGQNILPSDMQNVITQVQTGLNSFTSNGLWLQASEGQVPPGAVIGGHEIGGEKIYVARARHGGALIPGKLVPSHRCCYVSWGGREHSVKYYEVLCNCPGQWISSSRGTFPQHALPGGTSESGETLYIGRANHKGSQTVGKVQPSHKLCYIPYAGKEVGYKSYEIYVPN